MEDFFGLGGQLIAEGGGHAEISIWGLLAYLGCILAFMFWTMSLAKKGINRRVFEKGPARWYEQLYLFLENMALGIIGPGGKKYMPMLMTFWLVIFLSNVTALFMPFGPTADVGFNLGMALISIGYVQYEGIRANGLVGHFSHFAGPKLPLAMIPITIVIFLIEIVSEVMKNVSLSLRLFGNIHGGHEAVTAMNHLAEPWIPVGAFLLPIKLLTCIVQAMVFTLLTCVYLSLVTHHDDEHAHHSEEAHALEPAGAH
ncbi:MAG: F0F1 ATP synthase subunit A [Fimbriimonadaceae bacterium]